MSDLFGDDPQPQRPRRPQRGQRTASRRPRPVLLLALVVAGLLLLWSVYTSLWTDRLWFQSMGEGGVFSRLFWMRVLLFLVFGLVLAVVVGINLALAFRLRPPFVPRTAEQVSLQRYREVATPLRGWLLVGVAGVIGIFGGMSAAGQWRTYALWRHGASFGRVDPYFGKDAGFYVFTLPWLQYVVDFALTAIVLGLLASLVVHYLYAGLRLQAPAQKLTRGARAHVCVLLGLLMLVKALDYWLGRYELVTGTSGRFTGMTWTGDHAVLPARTILMAIAVICAVLFFVTIVRRTWLLSGVGIALFALSSVLLGLIWPGLVQKLQASPNEPDIDASYIGANIRATRWAFGLSDLAVTPYASRTSLSQSQLRADAVSLPGIRLLDPEKASAAFEQLQQGKSYYQVPSVLDVDRYKLDGRERDMVVAARDIKISGIPQGQNWSNTHTVYTHGYGLVAAYGNQRDAADDPVSSDGKPVFAQDELRRAVGNYQPRIYFGESSPEYSVVGRTRGQSPIELDSPDGENTVTYAGRGGVGIGGLWHRLLYATKFGDGNLLLSDRVNADSKILYDRNPRERVQKVAPWLTVDNDMVPSIVHGRLVWVLDGYTTSDHFPQSQKGSLQEMTSDAINPRLTFATLPTDQINYMRNAVKATVDAYDGTVRLYAWDTKDPVLRTWEQVFPGLVKPRSAISPALRAHLRYPEDLFKVQRTVLASYHVTDPRAFFEHKDQWAVAEDPYVGGRNQPPYRLSVSPTTGQQPTFSLTSVFTPAGKQNLAAFVSVGSDAAKPGGYGRFDVLRLPADAQVPGPGQIAGQFSNDPRVADRLRPFKQAEAKVEQGNLLTLPVGGGLLYVQPIYTVRESGQGKFPQLRFVVASFGKDVGIGSTLTDALDMVLGGTGSTSSGTPGGQPSPPAEPSGPGRPSPSPSAQPHGGGAQGRLARNALRLLQRADQRFRQADHALRRGDLASYQRLNREGRDLVAQAMGR